MKARNMAQCALFAALLTLCGWISVPMGDIAFTLQTFGVFLTLGLLLAFGYPAELIIAL